MNPGPADIRYPHLDLGDLIAEATGEAVEEDRAREHLAGCQHCQREASRWNLVAEGIRGLAANAPEVTEPVWQRRAPKRAHSSWRRALLAVTSAAAALALLLGVGAAIGVVHVQISGPRTGAALTTVTGCSQDQEAVGTLERVNGTSLVLQTASGRSVTVSTMASSFVSMSGPFLSDITDGAQVEVRGENSNGTLQAAIVTVGQPFSAVNPTGFVPHQGTATDATADGFTLVMSSGARIWVVTSNETLVVVPHASLSQLQTGTPVLAVGNAEAGGTLSAMALAAVSQLQSGPRTHVGVKVKDCSSSSIIEALGAVTVGRTPAS